MGRRQGAGIEPELRNFRERSFSRGTAEKPQRGRGKNGTELSPQAEGPTCVFGFFEIFEVVPGAGVGEGKGNRRSTQMNADEF
jgi:hypothetical protein